MRIVSWNILKGGGERAPAISQQLRAWNPDVVGLCEFRGTDPSQSIAAALADMGLVYQHATTDSAKPDADRLLLASRWPLYIRSPEGVLGSTGRWIDARIAAEKDFGIALMWVPNREEECTQPVFHKAVLETLAQGSNSPTFALGDTNTGVPDLDDHSSYFKASEGQWLKDLEECGWTDVWRNRNPESREYTYYNSHGNGFRIDQLFATRSIVGRVNNVAYDWGSPAIGKLRGPTDHAAIVLDVGL